MGLTGARSGAGEPARAGRESGDDTEPVGVASGLQARAMAGCSGSARAASSGPRTDGGRSLGLSRRRTAAVAAGRLAQGDSILFRTCLDDPARPGALTPAADSAAPRRPSTRPGSAVPPAGHGAAGQRLQDRRKPGQTIHHRARACNPLLEPLRAPRGQGYDRVAGTRGPSIRARHPPPISDRLLAALARLRAEAAPPRTGRSRATRPRSIASRLARRGLRD
jgi:hypothetical protein